MSVLEQLREEFAEKPVRNIFGFKKYPKGDAMLYLGARLKDAQQEKKSAEALAQATESAALKIIGRYDPQAARDFYAEVRLLKERYLQ